MFQQPFNTVAAPATVNHHPLDIHPPPYAPEWLGRGDSSDNRHTDSSVHHTGTENSDDYTGELAQNQRSSSDEKDNLTPAQSRRKAQNRAAYVFTFYVCHS